MKKLIALALFFTLVFISCLEPPVVFVSPQPDGMYPQRSIDMMYRGTFLSDFDSAAVHINNRIIYKEKAFAFVTTPAEIQEIEGVDLIGDQIIIAEWPEPLEAEVTDSLIYSEIILKDTLFEVGADQVLTLYKGHMILNKKITEEKWEVLILSLDDNLDLRLSVAEMPEDLDQLKKITPVTDISTEDQDQILLAPTYLEFEEIFRQRLIFKEGDVFKRVSSVLQI